MCEIPDMPTPSEPTGAARQTTSPGDWTPRTDRPRRSVFGNYRPTPTDPNVPPPPGGGAREPHATAPGALTARREAVDRAVARAFICRFLAKAYEDPALEGWLWLGDPGTQDTLQAACRTAGVQVPCPAFPPDAFADFHDAYLAAFGHAARGSCPLNEIEYGDLRADPLFQPHRLADLAAFYRAFGLEVAPEAGERHDHLALELEFLCVLAAKEAYALECQLAEDSLLTCREAQVRFLRDHLGRWTPAFTRRLAASTANPALIALTDFTRAFIEAECARFGVPAGSQDLSLRPVEEAEDALCASCGVSNLLPGASAPT